MTTRGANKEDGSALLRYLSLGVYAGILLFLTDGVSYIAPLIGVGIPTKYFFMTAFCAAVCCGIYFAIRGALSASATYRYFGIIAGSTAVFGFAACILASHLRLSPVVLILFGIMFGFGTGMLGIGKGMQMCELRDRQFLRGILLSSLIAGFIKILLLLLPTVWLGVSFVVLLIVSALMPVTLGSPNIAAKSRNEKFSRLAKGMVVRNWIFFCCLLLCLLVNTLPWTVAFTEKATWLALGLAARMGTAVGAIAASLLLLLLTRERFIGRLQAAMPIIPLLCTALLLVTWYVLVWNGGLNLFGGSTTAIGEFIANSSIGFSTILGLFILLWRLRMEVRLGLSSSFVYGILIAFIAGLFLVFIVLQYTLVQAVLNGVDSVLRIVFLVVTAIYIMKPAPMATPIPPERRIQEIGMRYGLSKREIEILALLMERRSAPYIAEVEFIALSTVKTHIKHLYEKTGAHDRKELLDIVYRKDGER